MVLMLSALQLLTVSPALILRQKLVSVVDVEMLASFFQVKKSRQLPMEPRQSRA